MKQLIVNADDFGSSPDRNQSTIEAHRKGIVTSATLLINRPAAAAGIELARAEAPRLGLGLHLNLTSGQPVLPPEHVPSLVDETGNFYPISRWAAVMDQFSPDELRAEIEAQFDAFVRLAGHAPDHLDSHHHAAYLHPAGLRTLLDLAVRHNLPIRYPLLDLPDEQAQALMRRVLVGMEPERTRALQDWLRAVLDDGPRPRWPDRLVLDYSNDRPTLGALLVALTTLEDGSIAELVVHPGYVAEAVRAGRLDEGREDELVHLTHAATRECVQSEEIHLVTFDALR